MQRFVFVVLLVAACGSDQPVAIDAQNIDAPGPPALAVTASPTTLAKGETVTFTVTATNFKIISPSGGAPSDREGHFHYYRDDEPNYTAGWTSTVTFRTGPNTALGEHTFRFVLANAAHEELTPSVEASANFSVQ